MAQPATNPKIEELRSRLKADPKNRIFYPLAEELRKVGQHAEAEQVLRAGLAFHPTYLSAWVSLGRVLRDARNDAAAVEALSKALQIDPGNVVAARLLGDAYLGLGEKVEAIKKYKLVQALLPGDEEIETIVEQLDRELNTPAIAPAPIDSPAGEEESPFAPEPSLFDASAGHPSPSVVETPFAPEPHLGDETATLRRRPEPAAEPLAEESPFEPSVGFSAPATAVPASETESAKAVSPFAPEPQAAVPPVSSTPSFFAEEEATESLPEPAQVPAKATPVWSAEPAEFDDAAAVLQREFQVETATGDTEPMSAEHVESPFEEPSTYTAAAFEVESPAGMHEARAPLAAEVPTALPAMDMPVPESAPLVADTRPGPAIDESDVFAPADEPSEGETSDSVGAQRADESDLTNTLTMADLYAKQGLVADARQIYENILQRDPANEAVRAKLSALVARPAAAEEASTGDDDRVSKLERWLSKVGKREVGRV